ncbi:MAG: serine/threonine protein kinase [Fuerstiella sp.]|nr:serine/threonine protein kinase [Fuerstiella sp.]MCP4857436.1 serine/threonine protein kinase [Fuerstiella sp.]
MKFTFAPEARPLDGYTIKRAVHRGGFGEVYYALSDAGKEVALKLLNNNLEIELRGVRQCLNLKHPNLVTIFDIRQDGDNDHWVIMEFVSGRGLYEVLRDYPNGMPLEEVLFWLDGIAAGLSFLHDRGIVHRDLKPANVFRDPGGVKIGDVGLSKYISESRRSAQTQSVGTVYYMAPEVAKGRYGREVDVYAMGIMLYEMITGKVPFDGQTTAEILMKHLTAEPELSCLPDEMRPVLAAALEKDPDRRTGSIEELQRQFRNVVQTADKSVPVPLTASPDAATAGKRVEHKQTPEPETVVELDIQPAKPAPSGIAALVAIWNAIPTPLQWVVGGAGALMILESGMLRPVAVGGMIGGAAYLGYQLLSIFVGEPFRAKSMPQQAASFRAPASPRHQKPVSPAARTRVPSDPIPARKFARNTRDRVYTPATLRKIAKTHRATDISTSITVSLAASALVTTAVFVTTNLLQDSAQAVYFAAITMLASWALIIPSKIWEGRSGDSFTRRLCLGTLGLGVGFLAAVLPEYLLISRDALFHGSSNGAPVLVGRVAVADGTGFPTVACFMMFFAALFFARRWWWQVDSFRKARFRVSSALFTLVLGIVITGMLQDFSFPDALGATWALAISAVVQLSAGWTPAEDRRLAPAPATDRTPDRSVNPQAHMAKAEHGVFN